MPDAKVTNPQAADRKPTPLKSTEVRMLIHRAGGAYTLADAITRRFPNHPLTPQAIYQWRQVPPARCKQIEAVTDGQLTRQEMRPDLFDV